MEKKQIYVTWIQIALQSTKTEELSVDIAKDVKARFDTSNYELETPKKRYWIIIQMKMDQVKKYDRACCIETKNIQLFNR